MTTEAEARARGKKNAATARPLPKDVMAYTISDLHVMQMRGRLKARLPNSPHPSLLVDADAMILRLWCERDIYAGALKQLLSEAHEQMARQERAVEQLRHAIINIISREDT